MDENHAVRAIRTQPHQHLSSANALAIAAAPTMKDNTRNCCEKTRAAKFASSILVY